MTSTAAVYERDGIVQVPGLLTKPEVEQIRTVFMDQVAKDHSLAIDDGVPVDDPLAREPRFVHPHRRDDGEAGALSLELMLDGRTLDVVTELIGPALGAESMFYFKPPPARGQ